ERAALLCPNISVDFQLRTIHASMASLSTIWRQSGSGMDKLASLRGFAKVVESGSFAEAGRQLRLSRSAISKYIADLEESLGVQLLNRTTRHASPTENGQRYFERAVVILSEIEAADQAVTQAQSAPRGLLRVN